MAETARLWDAASGKEIRSFGGHAEEVCAVAYSPDGKQVLTVSDQPRGCGMQLAVQ